MVWPKQVCLKAFLSSTIPHRTFQYHGLFIYNTTHFLLPIHTKKKNKNVLSLVPIQKIGYWWCLRGKDSYMQFVPLCFLTHSPHWILKWHTKWMQKYYNVSLCTWLFLNTQGIKRKRNILHVFLYADKESLFLRITL